MKTTIYTYYTRLLSFFKKSPKMGQVYYGSILPILKEYYQHFLIVLKIEII